MQVQVHACIQEHTHTPHTHIAQINGLGGVLWCEGWAGGALSLRCIKDDGSDPSSALRGEYFFFAER